MIKGIPYFGEQTQELMNYILHTDFDSVPVARYKNLYEVVQDSVNDEVIVVIDNKWVTWLNDIVFNYRDKECYIPYYSYKEYLIEDRVFKTNNKGHLILTDDGLKIRYEYKYNKINITDGKVRLHCVDMLTLDKLVIATDGWADDDSIDLDKLYRLYINSCYKDDDFLINKHAGGYHYIDKSIKSFNNKEKKLREQYDLSDYSEDFYYIKDYRDVRQYKYEEVIKLNGLLDNIELYRERRLRFESYLYCCLRAGLFNDIQFKKHIYKVGKELKLIIKDYWLDNIDKPNKTYIR